MVKEMQFFNFNGTMLHPTLSLNIPVKIFHLIIVILASLIQRKWWWMLYYIHLQSFHYFKENQISNARYIHVFWSHDCYPWFLNWKSHFLLYRFWQLSIYLIHFLYHNFYYIFLFNFKRYNISLIIAIIFPFHSFIPFVAPWLLMVCFLPIY